MKIKLMIEAQRSFFQTNKTKDIAFRLNALSALKKSILAHEQEIKDALYRDLNKAEQESYFSEIGMVLSELNFLMKHLRSWSRKHYVRTPLAQFYATSYSVYEPYGIVLIMAPWNYPFMLSMEPLLGAIAAGNCAVVKPSAYAPSVSSVIATIIQECFDESYVAVVEGGRKENTELLNQKFDYIFFTGGIEVGKLVMEKASKHLTPLTLELGGKSPCIVDRDVNVKLAARRIAFGKYLNAGQTCVAPDYVFLHQDIKREFMAYFKQAVTEFFGEMPLNNDHLPKIVNQKHFDRLYHLMENETIAMGGRSDINTLRIEPTLLDNVSLMSSIMQEEIFGPILPVIDYTDIEEVISYLNEKEKPLALYLFTRNKRLEKRILTTCSYGGGCINDTIIHLATSRLGFGGVGGSGMGSYHGKRSFTTFSHEKSIVKKATWIDLPFRYHPYRKGKEHLIRLFLR